MYLYVYIHVYTYVYTHTLSIYIEESGNLHEHQCHDSFTHVALLIHTCDIMHFHEGDSMHTLHTATYCNTR